jgi:hypothetical protein
MYMIAAEAADKVRHVRVGILQFFAEFGAR